MLSRNNIGSGVGHYITYPGKDVATNGLGVKSWNTDWCCLVKDWNGCCLSRLLLVLLLLLAIWILLPSFLVVSRQCLTLRKVLLLI